MEIPQFEIESYNLDFYVDKKYFGSVSNAEKDREVFGYQGRETSILNEDIKFKKGIIKKGAIVVTELIPICGKLIKQ